ncbi:unnamed protein product [Gongylonema pulchrum]|uniref:MFS domain-containing protein n=1 Tax=Gongylonema pulchrum TaxID=637853 RepID=A0A183CYZ4_9BILA|nr:unnamed protein product [Gongylonema pulchrum]
MSISNKELLESSDAGLISPFFLFSNGAVSAITEIKPTTEEITDWRSIELISAITFAGAVQFSMFFTSLWPYLQQVDEYATESFFGYITAAYSLGQAVANPVFGFWSTRINKTKLPVSVGLILMFLGNVLYLTIDLMHSNQRYTMLVCRFINGCGAGIMSVMRSYAIMASSPKDRARALSVNTGALALGLSFGPAFQIAFSPLGYPGWQIAGAIKFNMYTAPPIFCLLMNAAGLIFVQTIFREHYVDVDRRSKIALEQKS